jgi:hypothetical protein
MQVRTVLGGEFVKFPSPKSPNHPWVRPGHGFLLPLDIFGTSKGTECLNSFLAKVPEEETNNETQRKCVYLFPKFLFIILERDVWHAKWRQRDDHRIDFRDTLDMAPYAYAKTKHQVYQLEALIPHIVTLDSRIDHDGAPLRIVDDWTTVADTSIEAVPDYEAIHGNFSRAREENQTQSLSILPYLGET